MNKKHYYITSPTNNMLFAGLCCDVRGVMSILFDYKSPLASMNLTYYPTVATDATD